MARYAGADCRLCRREKMKLFLKGSKCESPKCPIEIRPYPPGEHGRGRSKDSEYLLQLREKQKARRIYGVLEKQFRGYYEEANRKTGKTGEVLLQILESRLDNVVYRAGFAESRDMARQLVRHGHIRVNGRKVDIPSYRVTEHDIIEVADKSRTMLPFEIAQAYEESWFDDFGKLRILKPDQSGRVWGILDIATHEGEGHLITPRKIEVFNEKHWTDVARLATSRNSGNAAL